MGVIDWIIIVFMLAFIINGFRRGLACAVIQLAGFVLAFFLVGHYYPLLANQLMLKYGIFKTWAAVFSIGIILVLIVVIVRLVTWFTNRVINVLSLSMLNRIFGAVLGIGNGLVCVIVFSVMLDYLPKISTPLKDSKKHKVYAAVVVLKEEAFERFKLVDRIKYIKMHQKSEEIKAFEN